MPQTRGNGKRNGKKKDKRSALKLIVIGLILALMLVCFYYYVSHKANLKKAAQTDVVTQTQKVLLQNLDMKYPPSPKEVVIFYSEITKCFYNETHSDEELYALAMQMQKLYDAELIANQTEEEYIRQLKNDIASMQRNGCVVSSYETSASTDVNYFSEDGYEWASLYCTYGIRQGTTWLNTNEKFLLRKDEEKHWKIYGWTLVE